MKKIIIALMALVATVACADITFSPFAFTLNDTSGSAMSSGTFLMVLDIDNSGFDFNNIAGDTWQFDANDVILDRGTIGSGGAGSAAPFWTSTTANLPTGFDSTDDVYLFWFDTAYDVAATGAGFSVDFGVENMGDVGIDPGTYTPFATGGNAQYETVPEPATALLLAIGAGCAWAGRRAKRHHTYLS